MTISWASGFLEEVCFFLLRNDKEMRVIKKQEDTSISKSTKSTKIAFNDRNNAPKAFLARFVL